MLIGGASSKFFHLKEFAYELTKFGVEYKLVSDSDFYDGFPSREISHWFQTRKKFENLIKEFRPDAVLIDRQRHFGLATIRSNLPLLVHLRGDFWSEIKWARETLYKPLHKRIVLNQWEKIAKECFSNASLILPICKYLENRTKEFYPNKKTQVMYQGITSSHWYPSDGLKLKHPCVGLLQGAMIWGKTKEMLILPKVLEKMSDVTFYWVGDGPYKDKIISSLNKFENFKWLGPLDYPEKIRDYLTEIDVYCLISGIDMSPLTLLEAQLMRKPVVATNVGGIPELMMDKETGFFVEKGNPDQLIEKISLLLNDKKKAKEMGSKGRNFVEDNFSWEKIAEEFVSSVSRLLNIH